MKKRPGPPGGGLLARRCATIIVLAFAAASVPTAAGRVLAGEIPQRSHPVGAPENPALIEFGSAVTFYVGFDNRDLIADLSDGNGRPVSRGAPEVLRPGLYGRALLAGKDPVVYRAAGNIDLSRPGALAPWRYGSAPIIGGIPSRRPGSRSFMSAIMAGRCRWPAWGRRGIVR